MDATRRRSSVLRSVRTKWGESHSLLQAISQYVVNNNLYFTTTIKCPPKYDIHYRTSEHGTPHWLCCRWHGHLEKGGHSLLKKLILLDSFLQSWLHHTVVRSLWFPGDFSPHSARKFNLVTASDDFAAHNRCLASLLNEVGHWNCSDLSWLFRVSFQQRYSGPKAASFRLW